MQEIDVSKYFSWIQDGKSFDEIRKDLQIRGFSDSQIATILATLNDWVLQSNFERERRNAATNWKWVGWILIGICVLLSVYSYWASAYTFIIFSIGGIISGWWILTLGNRIQRPTLFQPRFKQRRRNH